MKTETTNQPQTLQGFTPGPWQVADCLDNITGQRNLAVWKGQDKIICLISPKVSETDEDYKNAQLIASAPTLLKENIQLKEQVKLLKEESKFILLLNEGSDDESITSLSNYINAFDEDMDEDFINVINLNVGESYQYGADNIKRISATEAINQTK